MKHCYLCESARRSRWRKQPARFTNGRWELLRPVFDLLGFLLEKLLVGSCQRNKFDRQLIKLAGELKRHLVVVVHRKPGIHPDVEALVIGHDERNSARDRLAGDFLSVHRRDAGAAFAETGAIVLEVKHDGVLAGRERRWAFPAEVFDGEKVVGKDRLALEQVEAIATEAATERIEHPLGAACRDFHLGRDGVGLVEGVGRVAVGQTGYFARVGEHGLAGGRVWPRYGEALEEVVVKREHVVFRRLDQEQLLLYVGGQR